jgi:multicomponent Na+:H+ antiporter subunit A
MSRRDDQRSVVFDVCVDAIFRTTVLFSVFLLVAGHNAPGGGFVGGLVLGAALVIRFHHAGGAAGFGSAPSASVLLGVGLTIATLTAAAGWVWGRDVLEGTYRDLDAPVFGSVKVTTALFFDIGVYLVVAGLALGVLRTIGAEEDAS